MPDMQIIGPHDNGFRKLRREELKRLNMLDPRYRNTKAYKARRAELLWARLDRQSKPNSA